MTFDIAALALIFVFSPFVLQKIRRTGLNGGRPDLTIRYGNKEAEKTVMQSVNVTSAFKA